MPDRRRILALLSAATTATIAPVSFGQGEPFPNRPVTLILPGAAGTGVDVLARLAAQKLADGLGHNVLVDNVVGASGVIGVQKAARARPDGHALLFAFNQVLTMNPVVVENLPYDVERDLEPVALFAESPFLWLVNASLPIHSLADLIAHAKANPGKLAVGVSGFGSAAYLGMQLLSQMSGAEFLAVNYSGNIAPDLFANVVQLVLSPAAAGSGYIKTGKVRALAQTGARRAPSLPDIPTVAETFPDYVIPAWYSFWAPKGTPAPVVERLNAAVASVARLPDIAERLTALAATPIGGSAGELRDLTRRETALWRALARQRDLKPVQ